AIVGIAGVVIVFVSVLSISAGFSAAMSGAGARDRALILRQGSDTEMTSGIDGMEARILRDAPGIRHEGGEAQVSAELYVIVDLPKKTTGTGANVPLRGIEPAAMK